MELQAERDDVQKVIEDFKAENNKYMAEMNKRINHGKTEHDKLTREVNIYIDVTSNPVDRTP